MPQRRQVTPRLFEGLPVVDATEELLLHVTPADVKAANKKDPANCAAAKAGQRELKRDVRVFLTRTYVKEKDHWVRYHTPESASREIISFDRGSSFMPGVYRATPFCESARLGVYKPTDYHNNRGTKVSTRPKHMTAMVRERSRYDAVTRQAKKKKN